MKCNPKSQGYKGRTPLHHASGNGHMDIIKYLITYQGCDPAVPDNDGDMPIHFACLGGQLNVLKYLIIQMKCNPKSPGYKGRTPLHYASVNGHMDIIKYLIINQGCDPAVPDNDGDMPIHFACLGGQLNIVKYLITEMKCNPKFPGYEGRTPLHQASGNGHMDIIKYLITDQGCDPAVPDNDGDMPIHFACLGGQLNVLKYLIIQMRCNPKSRGYKGRTPLHYASVNGHMDIIKYLITNQGCDPAVPDNDGDMPIHFACHGGKLNIVKYLITEMKCNPKSPGYKDRTPLHRACKNGHMDIIKYLIADQCCDSAVPDNDGDMPIHAACLCGQLNVVKYLITQMKCSPKSPGAEGQTPLHYASVNGHMNIIKYLITDQGCDPVVPDNDGDMPIHTACLGGQLNVVKYLITEMKCNPKSPGYKGRTPLRRACNNGHMDIIKYLITDQGCDPAVPDNDGDMPIHAACLGGQLNVVKYLITQMKCNPKSRGYKGRTPLHRASGKGHMDIIKYLITDQGCDPALPDNDGNIPMHIACFGGHLSVVKYFYSLQSSNKLGMNLATSLHFSCFKGHMDVVKFLIVEQGCDPAVADADCRTPLHLACVHGHVTIAKLLLQDRRVDALCADKYGHTPVYYAEFSSNKYQLLNLFKTLLQSHKDYPIHSFSKVVLTGNSGAGKSSLAKIIIGQATDMLGSLSLYHGEEDEDIIERVTLTAGIDSYVVKSNTVGNMVLYDLAGQSEYYFSQSVIMETVIQRTPAIFINLVDLSKTENEIEQAVHHWLTFIENATCKTQEQSCIVMVGSHTDLLSKQQLKTKASLVKDLVDRRVKKQKYEGFLGMDCRVVNAEIMNNFFPRLLNCNTIISADSPPVSVYCHMLYAYLQTMQDKPACQLKELVCLLEAEDNSSVPSNAPFLDELLEDLGDKGVIIYLKSKSCLEKSWVVVKREIILKDINGELFKPKYFRGHHPIASKSGIIRMSSLTELYPQYNPEMLVELMVRLEFCHPVNLSGMTTNLQPVGTPVSMENSNEVLLFFPSLLKAKRPQALTGSESYAKLVRFGWCLGCKDYEYQFLSSRFLHVLLLRLAYTFPLPSEEYTKTHDLHKIERICTVWINGISWNNEDGIRTVVEVIQQNRWVVVTMYHNKDITRPVEYSKHRSAVIRLVLDLQNELAPDLDTLERLISPALLQKWPLEHLPLSDLFPIKKVVSCVLLNKPFILSCDGSHQLQTQDAVFFEPYHLLKPSSVCKLMDSSKSDQPVSSALLNEVRECCQQPQLESQSHLSLREHLDSMSIFTGRNPLVSM